MPDLLETGDSQSAKRTGVGAEQRGYDANNKKIRGRKRHLLVDTEGLVLKALPCTARRCPSRIWALGLLLQSAWSGLSEP